ncbi:MAG: glycosyltransferase [Rivularia sp. (in: Bacteria)]|nr:glycosyltransferase [Rivularia sp. MS3]
MNSIGVVVIGRNEGNRLKASLLSVVGEQTTVVYVDSGSTDDSVKIARSLGVHVVDLDLSIPFTAARARNAGFSYLVQLEPDIEFVQFVDGDCLVAPRWLKIARNQLLAHADVVVVCGRRREEFPENSIYNLLCDVEWNTPVGEAKACGGDSMMRVAAFKKVGGFNPTLIAGEEPELCVRLRREKGRILRLDADMTYHDAKILHFSQWWKREIRNGHAYAEGMWLHGSSRERHWVRESLRCWFWAFLLPSVALIALVPTQGLSVLLLLIVYALLTFKVYRMTLNKGFKPKDAIAYAIFCGVLDKYPILIGQIKFFVSKLLRQQSTIVEYKNTISAS